MAVEVRRIRPDEFEDWERANAVPFLEDHEPGIPSHFGPHLEADRTWAAVDGDRFVGTCCVFTRDVTVPPSQAGQASPTLPMAAVSGIGVYPTHRRRGLLLRLMGGMLDDAMRRGESIAGLLSTEGGIYGRFGFAWATSAIGLSIAKRDAVVANRAPEVPLSICDAEEASKRLPALFDRLRRTRAGQVSRTASMWADVWADPRFRRFPVGFGRLVFAIGDEGYVTYRIGHGWPSSDPTTLAVSDLMGATPEIEAALWQFVFSVDLVEQVEARRRPLDDPIGFRLADQRALRMNGLRDVLWIRVLDVPGALGGRGYQTEGTLVFEVESAPSWVGADGQPGPDPAAGTWTLDAGPDGASCRRAIPGEAADIRLGAAELGAVLLGGQELRPRAAAGRVIELRPGGLARADSLLAARPLPFCGSGF